jgi:HD-like signal output (HDOD) protein
MPRNVKLQQIIRNANDLPTLPIVASKMLQVVESEKSAAADLAETISKDQSLTAKVLKLVNSPFYGFSNKITTVSQGVVLLGFSPIRSLALGISVFKAVGEGQGDGEFDRKRFWEHSLGVGAYARLIGPMVGYPLSEDAFVAGLLHDIGKVIFDQYRKKEFLEAIQLSKKESIPLIKAETEILGASHALAGRLIAEEWGLPYQLQIAIGSHHNPPFRDTTIDQMVLKLICIVNLSDTICKIRKIGFSGDDQIFGTEDYVLHWLNVKESDIQRALMELDGEIEKVKEFFGIARDPRKDEGKGQQCSENQKILIIEEEPKVANMCKIFLENLVFGVVVTSLGDDYLKTIKEMQPKMILFDFSQRNAESEKVRKEIAGHGIDGVPLLDIPVPFESMKLLKRMSRAIQPSGTDDQTTLEYFA